MRPGQKLDDVVLDRWRVTRGGAATGGSLTGSLTSSLTGSLTGSSTGSSSGSSTKGFLKSHIELERLRGGRWMDTLSSAFTDSAESFLRVNQSPDGFPWTLIVSLASLSIVPNRHCHFGENPGSRRRKNLQPIFCTATLNFFQVHRYFPPCTFTMTCFN